jgi:pilus assembly protein CpaC
LQALLSQALKGLPIEPLVFVLPDGTVAAVLRGEVATPEEAKAAEALASLVATRVINLLRVRAVPQIPLSPEEQKALRIETAIGIPGVRVTLVDDKVVLHGTVNSLMERQTAEERAKPFGTIVNRIEVAQPKIRQFVTEVKVLEVSRTALQRLGITLGSVIDAGAAQPGQPQVGIFSVRPGQAIFGEPGTVDRPIARATPVGAQLDALVQNGLARLLANPQQRTIEGADATFLVGGLVPIPVFGFFGVGAGAAAPGAATVVFFPFGITLTLHPEASPQGEIFLQMRVEVTSPDFGLAVQVLGTTVPGFRFRGLDDVRLLLKDGDTIVISGLIQDELREQINRVPLLSRIPILGELFKSREFVRQQSELVLLVTVRTEEVPVSPEALQLLRTYQKRPVLPRPSFVVPLGGIGGGLGGGLGGIGGGLGGVGGVGGAPSGMPTPSP